MRKREVDKYTRELRKAELIRYTWELQVDEILIWERRDTRRLNVESTRGKGVKGSYERKTEELVMIGRRRKGQRLRSI